MTIIEDLKKDVENCKHKLQMERNDYLSARETLHVYERELKRAKTAFNAHYRYWKNAERELKRAKSRLSSRPSQLRQWTKNNMGKVMELIEK
jgi:hypothetical protein